MVLLLQVIKKLRDENPKNVGIHRLELSFFICWPDNNAEILFNKIKSFRKKYQYNSYTEEIIYDECLKILEATEKDKKYYKIEKITGESVDEYIRKMRSTGIISLRGYGQFIDFNNLEIDKINYILKKYSKYKTFTNKNDYFEYMGGVDRYILDIKRKEVKNEDSIRKATLQKYADDYSPQKIFKELHNVCNKKESNDPVFRIISKPARLEFLTSIALVQNFKNVDVRPNYIIDDEGLPTCTAAGGMADIICQDKIYNGLFEVTLICNRRQVAEEAIPIARHLHDAKSKNKNTVALFIAPNIHVDTLRYIKFVRKDEQLDIRAFNINDFIKIINQYNTMDEVIKYEV